MGTWPPGYTSILFLTDFPGRIVVAGDAADGLGYKKSRDATVAGARVVVHGMEGYRYDTTWHGLDVDVGDRAVRRGVDGNGAGSGATRENAGQAGAQGSAQAASGKANSSACSRPT